ncbi:hypothetical protein M2175_002867 [Bradyrhizobium elkanii]|uniref:hypothetical protein n=1 Tax=Bradyrhizobium TaxID=374 RepID=UPI00216A781A|nr:MULTISPECIES: hypothetical protein [Bradyrhizobium]MCS3927836.1 hypothetical protein [Bradyrhizobium elkanii]MCS3968388.1 hypothetical protein [Bradyrhizobium japonicum]
MGRAPQPLPQYTPPGPVEQMPNMATQPQCSPLAKVHSAAVFPYVANEVATSRTEVGHLGVDVSLVPPAGICQYLIIWDFGVDWRHLKNIAKRDPLLAAQLIRFETDKSLQFQIVGIQRQHRRRTEQQLPAHGPGQERLSPVRPKRPLARLLRQARLTLRVSEGQHDRDEQGRQSRCGRRNLRRRRRDDLATFHNANGGAGGSY